jgi:hypothetical protein
LHLIRRLAAVLTLVMLAWNPLGAQSVARAADVATPEAITSALYDILMGPAGRKRDWDRYRSLFHANARLVPTGRNPDGSVRQRVITLDEYITQSGPVLEARGLSGGEIGRSIDRFGNIAQVFSAYDTKRPDDPGERPFPRGINALQLLFDGARWWIVMLAWDSERPGNEIPSKYVR